MPGEQNTSVNSASSVENQTSVHDKLERASDEAKLIEETPDTVRGQLAELFHALRSRDDSSRNFLLRVVQPGLAGLMDGSVSTLAPIFATAFATHHAYYGYTRFDYRTHDLCRRLTAHASIPDQQSAACPDCRIRGGCF